MNKKINPLFVPYDIAILAKEYNFIPYKAGAYQTQENNRLIEFLYNKRDFEIASHLLAAPTYQQVVDWFRDEHGVHITPSSNAYKIACGFHSTIHEVFKFNGYYENYNAAIKEAFTILKNKKA